ncbi:MAG TPA: hypothetical protein VLC53_05440, partial [Myxococcota bacterium]|nr:hypothetical protein [Myxococcota bacterium]
VVLAARAAGEASPLTLDAALDRAAARAPAQVLDATRGLPYLGVAEPRHQGLAPREAARLETMARFFDAILADLDEAALSQRMAIAFVAFNRLRERSPGEAPTLEAERAYQELLSRRDAARERQRLARAALAAALGSQPPADVIDPELPAMEAPPGLQERRSRAAARNAQAERSLDEARANQAAGRPADIYGAVAAGVEAHREARAVEFAIALTRARRAARADSGASRGRVGKQPAP